ncbi:MAG: hypothetical protein K9M75_13260 [Phycisphaerae bacterium]|nr:hypothetical protein [Phycisphaerae bacterium]
MSINRVCKLMLILGYICGFSSVVFAEQFPLLVRAENIIVPPSTGPVTHLVVKNQKAAPCNCRIQVKYAQDWTISPTEIEISLKSEESRKIPISIDKAIDLESNLYPVEITVISGDMQKVFKQNVFVATTPVFTPKIDGNLNDWEPAVPISFETKGHKTIIRTGWNKKYFNVAVVVEEDELSGYKANSDKSIDAIQFAIAPRKTKTPTTDDQQSQRYEFLIVDSPGFMSSDKCFQLMRPGDNIADALKERALEPLQIKDAKVVVKRNKNLTVYECSIPLSLMAKLKPMTGRDYLMSFLVHDPDGTGIRDIGEVSGLWEFQRNKFAWSTWKGVKWQDRPPYDSKLEWGFSTSKY